jgi:hypothetical protein
MEMAKLDQGDLQRLLLEDERLSVKYGAVMLRRFGSVGCQTRIVQIPGDSQLLKQGKFRLSFVPGGQTVTYFAAITEGNPLATLAAVIAVPFRPGMSELAPWVEGIKDEHLAVTPPDVESLADACLAHVREKLGERRAYILTRIRSTKRPNHILGREYKVMVEWERPLDWRELVVEISATSTGSRLLKLA